MNSHDYQHPNCSKMDLEFLARHSDRTIFYRCKNCGFGGPERAFKEDLDICKMVREILQEPW